jgi:hypothetical protein
LPGAAIFAAPPNTSSSRTTKRLLENRIVCVVWFENRLGTLFAFSRVPRVPKRFAMSVSGVAGPNIPRSWTPMQDRRDDGIAQTAASNPADETGIPTTPFAGTITRAPVDSITVTLPNGMKVGMFHIGGGSSGFDAQMLASLEHLADNLSGYTTTSKGTGDGTQPEAVSDSSKNTESSDNPQGTQALDMFHVDLPNGISVEIRHASASGDADGGLAAMNEMEKAMEELVDHFSSWGGAADSGSTAANSAASQRALAAYAEQATQKDQAALTAGLGVSRAS